MAIVFLNGSYLEESDASLSIQDAGFLYGEGVYETLRTENGKVAQVSAHLDRLKASAQVLSIPLPPLETLALWLQEAVDRNGYWDQGQESRLRLTVSGGLHDFDENSVAPTILITVSPLMPNGALKQNGIAVITFSIERFLPEIKTTNLLPALLARRAMRQAGAEEVLLVDHENNVTEGSITNLFQVKKGVLITPKEHILPGTTRDRILEKAHQLGIPFLEQSVSKVQLLESEELFVCNAPRGILPVVEVDGVSIGERCIGPITLQLMDHFN
jgi:branched-subunit amino acid aminotransferase/4-amino-4-deoxychorismate lyase